MNKIVMTYTPRDGIRRVVCFEELNSAKLFAERFSECVIKKQASFKEQVNIFRETDCGNGKKKLSKELENVFQQRLGLFIDLDETRDPDSSIRPSAPSPFFVFTGRRFDIRDFSDSNVSFDELEDWFEKEFK